MQKRSSTPIKQALPIALTWLLVIALECQAFPQAIIRKPAKTDTVKIAANSLLILGDSTIQITKDTTLLIRENTRYYVSTNYDSKARGFFSKLDEACKKSFVTRQLYDWLVSHPKLSDTSIPPLENDLEFREHEGKGIRSITIKRMPVFGANVDDTTKVSEGKWLKLVNGLHMNTVNKAIRKNLLFTEGDSVSALQLAETERIIRNRRFINDTKIYTHTSDSSDSVDLVVVTQDNFPYTGRVRFYSLNRLRTGITNKNIFGLGHSLSADLLFRFSEDNSTGVEASYFIPNIFASFIDTELIYQDTYRGQNKSIRLTKDFMTDETRFAGAIQVGLHTARAQDISRAYALEQTDDKTIFFSYTDQDYWISHQMPLPGKNLGHKRISLSARLYQTKFTDKPEESPIPESTHTPFQDRTLVLGGIGLSSRTFVNDRFIYGFGRNEDIPLGHKIHLIVGHEFADNYSRDYIGLNLLHSGYSSRFGYIQSRFNTGGFLNKSDIEDAVVNVGFSYMSNLFRRERLRIRQFVNLDYTLGINRKSEDFLSLEENHGFPGDNNRELIGDQRLTLSMETAKVTDFAPFGFRIAYFTFADAGWIAPNTKSVFKGDPYFGFGLGIRARNDHLVFKTLQFRIGYYPLLPKNGAAFDTPSAQRRIYEAADHNIRQPEIIPYR
ncbi:hypothetical protein FUAX_14280 [Fulvitalea axinellae]|uniref:Bacterial surface antigen (D15) domain-containing protein n=1 Tax=Fulvitalea axinellae TaxID=1182444 RepID=A0AAU9D7Z0_9BACT|nr:hypothetical protein FUAX_14280 [Fulvitalea axinellae]